MNRFIAPLAACLLATPPVAQTGMGSITGTLNLDDARWIVAGAGERVSSAFSDNDGQVDITLVGTPDPMVGSGPGTLIIEIATATGAVDTRAVNVRIELKQEGDLLVAESGNIDLVLEAYEQTENDIALAGSFVATLTPEPQSGLLIDAENGVTLDGNFQATVPANTGTGG